MPVDIKKLFDHDLPAAMAKNAEEAKSVGARYQLNISGPTGGDWNIDVSATGPSIKPGSSDADCTISLSDEDFQKLYEDPAANATPLYFAGKLKITGNPLLAMKLQKLFALK
jgi:hypothetical protein